MNNQNYTKKYLRQVSQELRNQLSEKEIKEKSQQITAFFFQIIATNKLSIGHIFLPISHKKEINTFILLEEIWENYPTITTLTSVIDWENNNLLHTEITKNSVLTTNRWGIKEPLIDNKTTIFDTKKIDWVIVPLLAFDTKGFRVGYGKGFYDKFLANCSPEILKIGVNFFSPIDTIIDVDSFDIRLDCCILPDKIVYF